MDLDAFKLDHWWHVVAIAGGLIAVAAVPVQFVAAFLIGVVRPQFGACAPGHHGYQRTCVLSQRLSGRRFLTGLLRFRLICAVGAISNVGAAAWLYDYQQNWWLAGLGGSSGGRAEGRMPENHHDCVFIRRAVASCE
jgi:hypothetical protein